MTTLASVPPAANETRYYTLRRGAGIDGLTMRTRAAHALRTGEVRVRIRAVALNYRDLMLAQGTAGPAGRDVIPVSDGAGDIVEVGAGVTELKVGDRVISTFFPDWLDGPPDDAVLARALGGSMDGVLAEEVVLPATAWVRMPEHLTYTEGATLTCAGVTAWHALFGLEPLPTGASVALLGTGGVSTWALRLAKAAGVRTVVTSSDDAKLQLARAAGADVTVNYRTTPAWGQAILDATDGRGVDRVVETVGPATMAQSILALRTGGTAAIIGRLSGAAPAQFDPADLFVGAKRLVGLMVGSRRMTDDLARFLEVHRLLPLIDHVGTFEEAPAAYAALAQGRHVGKIVLRVP
jgi:NADPH:quinone reductase-like Zn-dependent oxidoreductase